MNLNQLKYFVAVAEHRSFSKAAEQYYLSQTAITQQVQKLEQTMQTQLIDRKSRPISLTPMGKIFLTEAKDILARMETALQRTREATAGLVGTLRVGYTIGYEQSSLASLLRNFRHRYPNVLVTCHSRDTDALAAGLINGEFDIIFTWDSSNICQEPQIQVKPQDKVRLVVALYGSHPLARRPGLTRADLRGETILFMSPSSTGDSIGDDHFLSLYQKAGYTPNILIRSSDVDSILMMVAIEEGISILPASCVRRLGESDNLVFIPLLGEDETEDILAVWRRDNLSPSLGQFLELLN